jgi:DNA modification methylase
MTGVSATIEKPKEYLKIGFSKTCDCPDNHLNCLTAKEWIKAQIGVWQFYYEGRDIRDKNLHPATFPIALAKRCVELFTHKGELVIDPFVGSGTVLIAARDLDRNALGFDLKEEYVELSESRLSQQKLLSHTKQMAIWDDARNIPDYLDKETVALSITSPPYANLLNRKRKNKSRRGDDRRNEQFMKVEQYSQDPRDLGTYDILEYKKALTEIYSEMLPLIKIKGHNVINVPDFWWNNTRIPLHVYVIEAVEDAGFELRNIIIWDRTNIVNRVGIFGWPSNYITMGVTFEYILDFWRPPP